MTDTVKRRADIPILMCVMRRVSNAPMEWYNENVRMDTPVC